MHVSRECFLVCYTGPRGDSQKDLRVPHYDEGIWCSDVVTFAGFIRVTGVSGGVVGFGTKEEGTGSYWIYWSR